MKVWPLFCPRLNAILEKTKGAEFIVTACKKSFGCDDFLLQEEISVHKLVGVDLVPLSKFHRVRRQESGVEW